jgi:sec-independent protein translocase protein TatB
MIGTLGGPELILILVIALIVFGPRKLPEIGKSIGRMMVEFRKASTEFRRTVEQEVDAEKRRPTPKLEKPRATTGTAAATAQAVGSEPTSSPEPGASPALEPGSAEPTSEARADDAGDGGPTRRPRVTPSRTGPHRPPRSPALYRSPRVPSPTEP